MESPNTFTLRLFDWLFEKVKMKFELHGNITPVLLPIGRFSGSFILMGEAKPIEEFVMSDKSDVTVPNTIHQALLSPGVSSVALVSMGVGHYSLLDRASLGITDVSDTFDCVLIILNMSNGEIWIALNEIKNKTLEKAPKLLPGHQIKPERDYIHPSPPLIQ